MTILNDRNVARAAGRAAREIGAQRGEERRELERLRAENANLREINAAFRGELARALAERDDLRAELREQGRQWVMVRRTVPPCAACGGMHPTYHCPDIRAALLEVAP